MVRRFYLAMCKNVDDNIGRLMRFLDESKLAENTIVVFTSDHGDLMGEYGLFQKGVFYDIVTRVPCIIAGPGVPEGRRVANALAKRLGAKVVVFGNFPAPAPDNGQASFDDLLVDNVRALVEAAGK